MAAADATSTFVSLELSDRARRTAQVELNETEESRAGALPAFREILPAHLAAKSDSDLISYLRVSKFDEKKAAKRLVAFDKYRRQYPDLFSCVDDEVTPEVFAVFEAGIILVPPLRSPGGQRIFIFNYARWNTAEVKLQAIQEAFCVMSEFLLADQDTQVLGFTSVHDLKEYSYSHAYQFTPTLIKRAMAGMNCLPFRTASTMFCHEPWYYSWLWKLCSPLLNEKMRSRTKFIGGELSEVHKSIPQECLPAYVGGTGDEAEMVATWMRFMRSYEQQRQQERRNAK